MHHSDISAPSVPAFIAFTPHHHPSSQIQDAGAKYQEIFHAMSSPRNVVSLCMAVSVHRSAHAPVYPAMIGQFVPCVQLVDDRVRKTLSVSVHRPADSTCCVGL
jgi:hypothetical protein